MSSTVSGTASGVGTGTVPRPTPPAYVSLVEEKKSTPAVGVLHSRTLSVASVFTRTTRAGSPVTWRTPTTDRKSTRLNSSHTVISYAVFCLKKKTKQKQKTTTTRDKMHNNNKMI